MLSSTCLVWAFTSPPEPSVPDTQISPSALIAVLKGMLAFALGKTCLDDWAKVMVVAAAMKPRTKVWRMSGSSRVSAILLGSGQSRTPGVSRTPRHSLHSVVILVRMIVKRRSKIHRWGVYATETIPKNTRIVRYAGEKISHQESMKRERRYIQQGHIWCFKLTNRTVIDAGVGGNVARSINHSLRPNSYIPTATL